MQVTWSNGATIGGSSGSPLINIETEKIVGVLTGGYTSCQDQTTSDYYGTLASVCTLILLHALELARLNAYGQWRPLPSMSDVPSF